MNACLYENSVSSTISIKALVDAFNKEVMLVAALSEYCQNYCDILLALLISVQITESRGNAVGGGVAGNSKLQPGHSTTLHSGSMVSASSTRQWQWAVVMVRIIEAVTAVVLRGCRSLL